MMTHKLNRYQQLVEKIFLDRYREGDREVSFERADLEQAASELDIKLPKNLGDIIYSFRYRTELPDSIRDRAPEGEEWVIRPAGRGRYEFALAKSARIVPSAMLAQIKIPDSTPGVIARYALDDEQALLAKLRYNRLIDLFTGLTCYPLQSHLRTTVAGVGQVETDEVYIGLDKRGVHYVLPVQAKGARDWLGIVQVEQDFALCARKFPGLVVRPIAAQFMADDVIALFEFVPTDEGVRVSSEAHYHLVRPEELSADELQKYRARLVT
ncbi:MAG: endonuclease [Anaerolineae bacterium]|nr:endonuclease [Anaerolineae bacterium]